MTTAHDAQSFAPRVDRALARWEGEGGALDGRDGGETRHTKVEAARLHSAIEADGASAISEQLDL